MNDHYYQSEVEDQIKNVLLINNDPKHSYKNVKLMNK